LDFPPFPALYGLEKSKPLLLLLYHIILLEYHPVVSTFGINFQGKEKANTVRSKKNVCSVTRIIYQPRGKINPE